MTGTGAFHRGEGGVWKGVKRSEDAWVACSDPVEAQQVEVWSYDAKCELFAVFPASRRRGQISVLIVNPT